MRSSFQFKTMVQSVFVALALASLGFSSESQAVTPPPDGGYPNFTTAEGTNALQNLTTGIGNTAVGWYSLFTNSTGLLNTGLGAGTLVLNNSEENTATGAGALLSNTDGFQNTANGAFALLSNTIGDQNTAIGDRALQNNTEGGANTATGFQTLSSNLTGNLNTAYGDRALFTNTAGNGNTAVGFQALFNTTGSENIAVGHSAGGSILTASHVIAIGHGGADVSNTTWIGNIFGVTTVSGTTAPVVVSDNGQLGTMSSSRRFKKEIKAMDNSSEAILALRPVTFHYKADAKNRRQFGLIAEEVAEVDPDLVVRDKSGEIYTVRYDAVNAMLLNEFIKEHYKVEKQEETIAKQHKDFEMAMTQLQKKMEALTARLKEQDAKIQKVSAQNGMSNATRKMVVSE